jgi:hypothetical protein
MITAAAGKTNSRRMTVMKYILPRMVDVGLTDAVMRRGSLSGRDVTLCGG